MKKCTFRFVGYKLLAFSSLLQKVKTLANNLPAKAAALPTKSIARSNVRASTLAVRR